MTIAATMLFPAFFNLEGRQVTLVGGGAIAERKARLLLRTGARLAVVAPTLTPWLRAQAGQGAMVYLPGVFSPAHLDGSWLAVAATDSNDVNQAVAEAARQRRIPCNVVDDPAASSFQVPAIVDRAPLVLAVSSGGHAPVLARRIRERLEGILEESLGDLAGLAARYRRRIVSRFPDLDSRRDFYGWMLDGPLPALLAAGKDRQACQTLDAALAAPGQAREGGATILLGAYGPADLLSLRALRGLNQADLIAHAPDVNPDILDKARRDADRIEMASLCIGQTPGGAEWDALIRQMASGRRVVVLPGRTYDPALVAQHMTARDVPCVIL